MFFSSTEKVKFILGDDLAFRGAFPQLLMTGEACVGTPKMRRGGGRVYQLGNRVFSGLTRPNSLFPHTNSRWPVTSQNNHIKEMDGQFIYPCMANSWHHKPPAFHARILTPEYLTWYLLPLNLTNLKSSIVPLIQKSKGCLYNRKVKYYIKSSSNDGNIFFISRKDTVFIKSDQTLNYIN